MAYGIEELAEMKVTGPVQGGDMVAKPNEMPVGAAALLSKMQKKNTPGIFKLPEADKKMPSFMKVAAEGVEEQNTANLEDAEIMRIMGTYGVGPEEARRIYDEMIYGYERDEAAISPTDWRSILKMIESGMTQEEIDAQLAMNEVRNDVQKVSAFAPEGHMLAYITPDEGEMLKMMGGSGETNPITGIKQYPPQTSEQAEKTFNTISGSQANTQQKAAKAIRDRKKAAETMQQAGIGSLSGSTTDTSAGKKAKKEQRDFYKDQGKEIPDFLKTDKEKKKETTKDTKSDGDDDYWYSNLNAIKIMDGIANAVSDWETEQVKKLMESLGTDDKAVGLGNLLRSLSDDEDRRADFFARYGDEEFMEDILGDVEKEQGFDMEVSDEEMFKRFLEKAEAGGGDTFKKTYNPREYYKAKPGESSAEYQKRMRELGTTPQELAQLQREGKIDFSRANTMMIQEGRERLSRGQDNTQSRGGGGGPSIMPVDEVGEVLPTPDERAGQFNLGGTMKYTDDLRTGGTEMDVPLGRRFAIDKSGKYRGSTPMDLKESIDFATIGGYNQLEPFQEYLTRRRKELGEQPDEWFDEEGNVLFSRQA